MASPNPFRPTQWIPVTHPVTGVTVWTIIVHRYTKAGNLRSYPYRIAPEDLRTGKGAWRVDYYDFGLCCAATSQKFSSRSKAALWLRTYHESKVREHIASGF